MVCGSGLFKDYSDLDLIPYSSQVFDSGCTAQKVIAQKTVYKRKDMEGECSGLIACKPVKRGRNGSF